MFKGCPGKVVLLLLLLSCVFAIPENIEEMGHTANVTYGEEFRYHAHYQLSGPSPTLLGIECTYYVVDSDQIPQQVYFYEDAIDTAAFNRQGYTILTGNNGTINVVFSTLGLDIGETYNFEIFCGDTSNIGWDYAAFTVNYEQTGELFEDVLTFLLANIGNLLASFFLAIWILAVIAFVWIFVFFFPNLGRPNT